LWKNGSRRGVVWQILTCFLGYFAIYYCYKRLNVESLVSKGTVPIKSKIQSITKTNLKGRTKIDHLEHPQKRLWEDRRKWFENLLHQHEALGSYFVSEQACALIAEAQSCFCAGAWVSVIILAFTVIDAQLRETEVPDFKGHSKELIEILGFDERFQKLRKRRNKLIHSSIDKPAISVDQQWGNRKELEEEAREAVKLMIEAFYLDPGS
jgi:hypothetical protein